MTASRAARSALPADQPNTALPPAAWESYAARAVTRWGHSGAVVTVDGELDAANAEQLADYVRRWAVRCEWLVLDLNDLQFIGTAGFSALESINAQCLKTKVYWAMVPGVAVSRLLEICDPHSALPTVESVVAAQGNRELLRLFAG